MKLSTEIMKSSNEVLINEKNNLTKELKETRTLYRTYEQKCTDLMNELSTINVDY